MVQIIDDPYTGNIAGRIGKGFAKGLSESLPEEIKRGRLSYGIEQLGKEDLSQLSPLQKLARVANIYGMTPEMQSAALQQIQNQAFINQNTAKKAEKTGKPASQISGEQRNIGTTAITGQPKTQPSAQAIEPSKQSVAENINAPLRERGLAAPEEVRQYLQSRLQEPPSHEINELASEFLQSGAARNEKEAKAIAYQQLKQNITAQNERIADFRKGLSERMKLDLQNQGLGDFTDILGKVQQDLLDQGEYRIAQGATPQAAEKEIQDVMRDFALATTQTQNAGKQSLWSTSAKDKITAMKAQKELYDKYGYGEQFIDVAQQALGSTPLYAAAQLEPLKNDYIKFHIDEMKEPLFGTGKIPQKKLDEIIEKIKPNDNLLSIAYALREKHRDVNQFMERVQALKKQKKFFPSEEQGRQMYKPINNQFYGDIALKLSPLIPKL